MTIGQRPSPIERELLQAVINPKISQEQISLKLHAISPEERFVLSDEWRGLARDRTLEDWRRLLSYDLLISRCLIYPCGFDFFKAEALAPLGLVDGSLIDMTMAQHLPFERHRGEIIRMANLPISTALGPAAVYMALGPPGDQVLRAAVYPRVESP